MCDLEEAATYVQTPTEHARAKKEKKINKSAYEYSTKMQLMLTSKCWRGNFIVYISICAYAGKDFKKAKVMARKKYSWENWLK